MSRRRPSADRLPFDTFRLEGALFVPELLERAARGEAAHQKDADYSLPRGLKLHDEYGRAFRIASATYHAFAPQTLRADLDHDPITRGFVLDLLRQCLGFTDLALLPEPVSVADRGFPITAHALGGRIPVVIAPHHTGLDEPVPQFAIAGAGARRKSAHQLAQEYLNAAPDALWALVSNGKSLRLLRDADTLTRPNFLEFDLETILRDEQQRYADFAALWRILHVSRAGAPQSAPADCVWEKWKAEGHSQGLRVRDGLREGVTQALIQLGTGFIAHPANTALRTGLQDGALTKDAFFQQLLRLVYRCLFLFCAEERELLHAPDADPAARNAYAQGFALRRFRQRSLRQIAHDPHEDLWQSVRILFSGLATGQPRLALPALGGLFASGQCPDLDASALSNRALLTAMRNLRWAQVGGGLSAIDYRNMGPEELGSVYESLLELVPQIQLAERTFGFVGISDTGSTAGNARKTSGSYYTPDSLVKELIRSALDPVIAQRIAEHPQNPVEALLNISLIDPACGSGHFLIAGARRLAEKLAELRAPEGAVKPDDYRAALREVVAKCIHGVDRNPLALELARTTLWLESVEPGKPLSFLDHHLICGDALLGLTRFEPLTQGIPDDAFSALSGDDKKLCTDLKKRNKAERKQLEDLQKGQDIFQSRSQADGLAEFAALEALPDGTPGEIAAKETAWRRFLDKAQDNPIARAADVFVAAFLTPKNAQEPVPTTTHLTHALFPGRREGTDGEAANRIADAQARAREARVLHWPLAFPRVFARGGFDCILGNPPWERIKLQEEEFFATREPLIADAKNKAERGYRIQWLSEGSLGYHLLQQPVPHGGNPAEIRLYNEFITARRTAEASSVFAHVGGEDGGRFPLTGVGDVNTYALFSETISQLTAPSGRAGFIVPTGIATDDSTKQFFAALAEGGRLVCLWSFENEEFIFSSVHHAFKFCLLVISGAKQRQASEFVFFGRQVDQIHNERRRFSLTAQDFRLINPNTRTCPVFRSRVDAELTRAIYRRVPVLIEEERDGQPERNPWRIRFMAMIHMANDSGLFSSTAGPGRLPLYEAKMIHQFDHRWASYGSGGGEDGASDLGPEQKANPALNATPRYWVSEREVLARLADVPRNLSKAWIAEDAAEAQRVLQHWVHASRHAAGGFAAEDTLFAPRTAPGFTPDPKLDAEVRKAPPLTPAELAWLETTPLPEALYRLHDTRSPRWLMGWRDITNATNERTVIASVLPRAGTGDTLLLMFPNNPPHLVACLLADQNSLPHDYVARQKIGGTHLKYHVKKQLPVLPLEAYSAGDLAFIVPRVLELTYTAHDLRAWAEDVVTSFNAGFPESPLSLPEAPYGFVPERRAELRAELDAKYARLYGLSRDELRYILNPADTHGADYPSETFRVLKNNEHRQFGEYRTQRLVLAAWDRMEGGES
jgi:hypothetical protein